MTDDVPQPVDASAWTGRSRKRNGPLRGWIVFIFAGLGPMIGTGIFYIMVLASWVPVEDYELSFNGLTRMLVVWLVSVALGVPYIFAGIPALLTGIAVAWCAPDKRRGLAAACITPLLVLAAAYLTGGTVGMVSPGSKPHYLIVPVLGYSLICWRLCWRLMEAK